MAVAPYSKHGIQSIRAIFWAVARDHRVNFCSISGTRSAGIECPRKNSREATSPWSMALEVKPRFTGGQSLSARLANAAHMDTVVTLKNQQPFALGGFTTPARV